MAIIILDTNVISESLKPAPSRLVMEWQDKQEVDDLYITAVSEAELRLGVSIMPVGRRRSSLSSAIDTIIEKEFPGRVLPFDHAAARHFAEISAYRRAIGRPIRELDCQIVAIARACGAAVATRNVADFIECGVPIINPWQP